MSLDEIILFLSGKEETLIEILKEKMNSCAMEFKFEDAAMYRDKIKNLEEIKLMWCNIYKIIPASGMSEVLF